MIKEWVLGAVSSAVSIVAVPSPSPDPNAARSKVAAGLVGVSEFGAATFSFRAYDPAFEQAPAETRVYAIELGDNGAPIEQPPADASGYIASTLPFSATDAPVPPEGAAAYVVPVPAACVVGKSYLFQALHGYA